MKKVCWKNEDAGFTLVELLVSMVLLPIVMGGLVVMLIAVFQTQSSVANTLTGSDDSSVASTLVNQDVASSTAVTSESAIACGSVGFKQILGTKDSLTSDISSYVLVTNGTKDELYRETCSNSNTTTPISQTLVSADVPSTLSASVYCGSNFTTTCGRSSWEYSASVSDVYLKVTETNSNTKTYSFAISAVPSLWNAASVGETDQEDPFPIPPLDILGGSTTCTSASLTVSGNAAINIAGGAGVAFDNSTCNGSISLSGNANIDASGLETGDSPASAAYTSGSPSSGVTSPSISTATPTGDPFAGLTPPSNPSASGSGSCASNACTPGNYASSVSLSGGTWTVDPGTYVFTQPVSISGKTTVTFGSGTYLFEGGLSIAGQASVTFDSGTYILEGTTATSNAISLSGQGTVTDGPGGSLFYVESGVVAFSGNGDISLSGETAYDGIAIWQAATDTNVATLSGNSGVDAAYGGVYVPDGEVEPSGNSIVSASFIVAAEANFSGNSGLDVG